MADQLIRVNSENYVMASDVLGVRFAGGRNVTARRRQAATASMLIEIKPASSR